jgi:hypothetical protein
MPALDEYLPESRVLEAQTTYTIPLDFAVPHRLCIGAFSHACSREDVVEKHARLPPTVGCNAKNDKSLARQAFYTRSKQSSHGKMAGKQSQTRHVRRLQSFLSSQKTRLWTVLQPGTHMCCLARTKNVRERRFEAPVGSLTTSTRQPHAITRTADGCGAVGSCAQVDFEFVPLWPDAVPPQVQVRSVKIRATTLYTTTPFDRIPQSSESIRGRAAETFSHCCTRNCLHLSREISNWEPLYMPRKNET